jgi:hypothetical protein
VPIISSPQSVQTQNLHNLTISGNTAGVLAGISSGTLTLAGGNNITLSQAGNAITISGAAAGGAQTAISGIAASNTTYTSGSVTISGVGGGVTVGSNTGQRVDISVAAPVAQTAQTGISSIAASNTTYTSGGITITGSNMVTVRSTTGQGIVIDATQSVQTQAIQTGISGIAASNTTYTSGSVTISGVGGGVTVSSNTGQRIDISVAAPVAQTVQTQNVVDVTMSGNTAGVMALVSSGTLTLAGGNNITLSQVGNAVTISGAAAGGAQTAISGIAASNTTYTSGTVTFSGVGGGITVGSNTGQRVDLSVAAQSVQTQNMVAVSATNTLYSSGTVLFTGSNMITVKSSGVGQTIILDATQSVQTQNLMDLTLSGNTSGALALVSSGTLTLAGGNNITLSQAGNAITISGAAAGGAQTAISGIAASNTTYTSGSVTFSGVGGGVTVNSNTGQRVDISVATPVNFSAGVSTGGNTAGATGITGTNVVFVGTNGITLSQTTGANGATISISGGAGGGGGVNIAASGATYTSGTVEFDVSDGLRSALNIVTSGAQSVIITDNGPTLAYWARGAGGGAFGGANITFASNDHYIFPLKQRDGNRFDGLMTLNQFRIFFSFNATATSISQQLSSTMNVYLYTRNSDTLSILNSASMTFGNTVASSNNSSNWNGVRGLYLTNTSQWSASPVLSYGGEYYIGLNFRSHITSYGSVSWLNLASVQSAGASGMLGQSGGTSVMSKGYRIGYGYHTSTGNTASLAFSAMTNVMGAAISHDPLVVLVNSTVLG